MTSPMLAQICSAHGARCLETFTGFKHIAALAEGEGENLVLGLEESGGYMLNPAVRDKDGLCAALLIVEMALWHHARGKTLREAYVELEEQYGYCAQTVLYQPLFAGEAEARMQALRARIPQSLGLSVEKVIDYLPERGQNVLRLCLAGGSEVLVRPSGTEPVIKTYVCARADSAVQLAQVLAQLQNSARAWMES